MVTRKLVFCLLTILCLASDSAVEACNRGRWRNQRQPNNCCVQCPWYCVYLVDKGQCQWKGCFNQLSVAEHHKNKYCAVTGKIGFITVQWAGCGQPCCDDGRCEIRPPSYCTYSCEGGHWKPQGDCYGTMAEAQSHCIADAPCAIVPGNQDPDLDDAACVRIDFCAACSSGCPRCAPRCCPRCHR
jgi:hypothetical protein